MENVLDEIKETLAKLDHHFEEPCKNFMLAIVGINEGERTRVITKIIGQHGAAVKAIAKSIEGDNSLADLIMESLEMIEANKLLKATFPTEEELKE